jgi:hypothetical protein
MWPPEPARSGGTKCDGHAVRWLLLSLGDDRTVTFCDAWGALDQRRSAIATDNGGPRRHRGDVAALGNVGHETLKRRNRLQPARVLNILLDHHMDEGHPVLKPENLVCEPLRLSLLQIGEHRVGPDRCRAVEAVIP